MTTQTEALRLAAARFREYEASHQAKLDDGDRIGAVRSEAFIDGVKEKVTRNREMAEMCEAALALDCCQHMAHERRQKREVAVALAGLRDSGLPLSPADHAKADTVTADEHIADLRKRVAHLEGIVERQLRDDGK